MMLNNALSQMPHVGGEPGAYSRKRFRPVSSTSYNAEYPSKQNPANRSNSPFRATETTIHKTEVGLHLFRPLKCL